MEGRWSFPFAVHCSPFTVRCSLFAVHCSQSLVDPDYLYRYNYYPNQIKSDTLFYEKATLNRWLATVVPSSTRMTAK